MGNEDQKKAEKTTGRLSRYKRLSPDRGSFDFLVGLGFTTYGGLTMATLGSLCPACAIAAPIFIGSGLYKRLKGQADLKKEKRSPV
ncbi:MAG: hypothetical protein EA369_05185 [Bradymonadales bacterium]|nr:MAG: hypothetical protein EA369_05185 [Bradymonadales bacterium]